MSVIPDSLLHPRPHPEGNELFPEEEEQEDLIEEMEDEIEFTKEELRKKTMHFWKDVVHASRLAAVEFATSTTMHSCPYIVIGRGRICKILWACICVSMMVLLGWHIMQLIFIFLERRMETMTEHSLEPATFPDIIACPLSLPKQFETLAKERLMMVNSPNYATRLNERRARIAEILRQKNEELGNILKGHLENIVKSCSLRDKGHCNKRKMLEHPAYLACRRIQIDEKYVKVRRAGRADMLRIEFKAPVVAGSGDRLALDLENGGTLIGDDGLDIYLVPRDSPLVAGPRGDMATRIPLSYGEIAEASFEEHVYTYSWTRSRFCNKKEALKKWDVNIDHFYPKLFEPKKSGLRRTDCLSNLRQAEFYRRCGCVSEDYPITDVPIDLYSPPGWRVKLSVEDVVNDFLFCHDTDPRKPLHKQLGNARCHAEVEDLTLNELLAVNVKKNITRYRFRVCSEPCENIVEFKLRTRNILPQSNEQTAILELYPAQFSRIEYIQGRVYDFTTLSVEIAGTCGLYLGISFITLCEILVFLLNLMYIAFPAALDLMWGCSGRLWEALKRSGVNVRHQCPQRLHPLWFIAACFECTGIFSHAFKKTRKYAVVADR